ncbi:MAG: DUF2085 domain-containing protein, partial [Acidobacteria bacterium]|nr:DUF2085 domain-containing protein [Acidobacteriota bacterium]
MTRGLAARAILVSSCGWVVLLAGSPLIFTHSQPDRAVYHAAALVYGAASWICHQRPERSFHIESIQLPVCARCFGLYVGVAFGACASWWKTWKPTHDLTRWRTALVVTGAIAVVTLVIEWGGLLPG